MDIEDKNDYGKRVCFYKSFGFDIEAERKFILDKAKPLFGRILEVGTGKGYFTVALANAGYEFVSVDISSQEQEIARLNIKKLGLEKQISFQIADAEALSFEDNSFDVIFCVDVVHHLPNLSKVMDELLRVIAPKGKIVLSDFAEKGFELIAKVHESEGRHHDEGKFSLKDIVKYLKDKDITTEEHRSDFHEILVAHC